MIIAIDGPSGSGKSTLSRLLAQKLGYFCLNSGYLYRALGYILVSEYGYDEQKLRAPDMKDIHDCFESGKFIYDYVDEKQSVYFAGKDITAHLKKVSVSGYASLIARDLEVREILKKYQRNLASNKKSIIVEGRDCGSVVFVDAGLKFFITASFEVRARRLQNDQRAFGKELSYEEAYELVVARDRRDREREHAPLVEPEGAIIIDTSELSVEESLENMLSYIK